MTLTAATCREFVARCESAGLSAWRIDLRGKPAVDPSTAGSAAADAAGAWNAQATCEPQLTAGGEYLLGFPIGEDGTRTGYVAVLTHACSAASAAGIRGLLDAAAEDLHDAATQANHLDAFTVHLSDAYETITALYAIGRSMADVAAPDRFINAVVARLHETTPFKWVACSINTSDLAPDGLSGFFCCEADTQDVDDAVRLQQRWFRGLAERLPHHDQVVMLRDINQTPPEFEGETIVVPIRRREHTIGLIAMGSRSGAETAVCSYDTMLLEATAGYVQSFLDNVTLYQEQRDLFLGVVKGMTAAIDAKDAYTRGHSERVALVGRQLAETLGMPADMVERVYISGLVHDVGKIGVPERVLCKPSRLTDDEFAQIKQHPEIGHHILKGIASMAPMLPGVLSHHERWDGKGYPNGLRGEEIPEMARVLCLADTFDAMSSSRAYRPGMSRETVLAEIRRCSGTQFDPSMVPAFLELDFTEFDRLASEAPRQNVLAA